MNTGMGKRDRGGVQPPQIDIALMFKRINCIVNLGTVAEADYDAGKVRVKIAGPTSDEQILTDWIPWSVPSAANDEEWDTPEVNEQVVVFAPSGDMRNAFVMGAVNKEKYPHVANNPDYHMRVYRHLENPDDVEPTLDAIIELNRRSGKRHWWIKEKGSFRWEIGGAASILLDKDTFQARVGTTQIVIQDGSIALQVNGRKTEWLLDADGITGQNADTAWLKLRLNEISASVAGTGLLHVFAELVEMSVGKNGVLSVRRDHISAKLEAQRVRIGLFGSQIKAMVGNTWLWLTSALWELRTQGSAITGTPASIIATTPEFIGPLIESEPSGAAPATYDQGEVAEPFTNPTASTPYQAPKPPDWPTGKPPYRPTHD